MLPLLALVIGAGLLGFIIVIMDDGDFPGWFRLMLCAVAALIPAAAIPSMLPPQDAVVGVSAGMGAGVVVSGFAISALCGMTFKRGCIAAGIYLFLQMALMGGAQFLMQS